MKAMVTGASSGIGEAIAKYAVDKMLKGKAMIIPGFRIKFLIHGSRLSPYKLSAGISYQTQFKREAGR